MEILFSFKSANKDTELEVFITAKYQGSMFDLAYQRYYEIKFYF